MTRKLIYNASVTCTLNLNKIVSIHNSFLTQFTESKVSVVFFQYGNPLCIFIVFKPNTFCISWSTILAGLSSTDSPTPRTVTNAPSPSITTARDLEPHDQEVEELLAWTNTLP